MRNPILCEIDTAIDITSNGTTSRNVSSRTKLASRKRLSTNHMIKNQRYSLSKSCCSSAEIDSQENDDDS